MNCSRCGSPLEWEDELRTCRCRSCRITSSNFDQRSWMDEMFMDSRGGEF